VDGNRSAPRLQFGAVTLIPNERLVLKDGHAVPFTPKAFDLLVVLAENPGRLLTKDHLMQAVWPDTAVEESNLAYHIFAIRKALGENADADGYIETVPKHGYRFVAPVVLVEADGRGSSSTPEGTTPTVGQPEATDLRADGPAGADRAATDSGKSPVRRQTEMSGRRAARRWRWAGVAAIPILLSAAYIARQAARSPDSPTPLRAVPLTSLPGVVGHPSFSPDGNNIAFTWNGPKQDNPDIYVQQIGAGSPLRLTTDPGNDYSPVWSPDGRSIAFLRQQPNQRLLELRLIAPLGGSERMLTEIRPHGAFLRPVTLGWCPDSKCVVVTDAPDEAKPVDALFIVSLETGERRQLTYPSHLTLADTDPAVSPDGKWLVFRRDVSPFTGQLQLLALGGDLTAKGEPRPLTAKALGGYGPTWLSDTAEIIFSAKSALWRLGITDGSTAKRLAYVGEDGLMPVVSRPQPGVPARLAYVRSFSDTNIWRIETTGPGVMATSPPVVAISSTRRDDVPEFSPDGRHVLFTSDRSGESEMWVADSTGKNPIQLTSMGAIPGFGRWSPDGKTIAFHSNPENRPDIIVVPANGGRPRNLTAHFGDGGFPSFSHDGEWIYFASFRTGKPLIYKLPATGGDVVQVSQSSGLLAIESPDGAYLYYVENTTADGPGPLVRLSLKGGEVIKLVENVVSTSFAVIDGGIYYIERIPGETRLQYFDLSTRQATVIARNLGNVGFGLTASRDGRSILYSRLDSTVDELMLVDSFR
jgi:Tol biopolymer transport system component/DNA-binding winged helix-turn-helix (wHTH) protein